MTSSQPMNAVQPTMNRRGCLWVAAALFMMGACSNTTAPTAALPTTTTVTTLIAPANTVLQIGQTQVYSLSTATSANVVTWTSSNLGVLAIDATGLATGLASGVSTITASSDSGSSSTLTVQVVPNYQGSWAGTATVLGCTDLSGFVSAGYCSQIRGAVQTWTLILTQDGLTLSGTMTKSEGLSVLSGSVAGAIGASGDIIKVTGTLSGVASGANLAITPISWDSFATGGSMLGAWAANVTSNQIDGSATVQWSLTGATAVSASGARGR